MSRSAWTEELVEKLKALVDKKLYSSKEIGDMLGFSKNAIVGKINRLGLNKQDNATTSRAGGLSGSRAGGGGNKSRSNSRGRTKAVEATKEGCYQLSKIDDNMCVWPQGDDDNITFCGRPILERTGKFYCVEHFKKAYLRFSQKK